MPASFAAAENVSQVNVRSDVGTIPGSAFELPAGSVTLYPNASLPVKRARIVAPAALKTLCPEKNSGNGGVNDARDLIRPPVLSEHGHRPGSRAAPPLDLLPPIEKTDRRHRPDVVVVPLRVPGADARVQDRVAEREEHLHVVIEPVMVATRDELPEERPVAGRELRIRAVGKILGAHLLPVGQRRGDREDLVGVLLVLRVRVEGGTGRPQGRARRQREGRHESPLRRRVNLCDDGIPGQHGERLPAVRIRDERRRIHRDVSGVIGVRARREVAELVRAVRVPRGQDRRRGGVAHSPRRGGIHRAVLRRVPLLREEGVVVRGLGGEEVDDGAVAGVADRFRLVGAGALRRRAFSSPCGRSSAPPRRRRRSRRRTWPCGRRRARARRPSAPASWLGCREEPPRPRRARDCRRPRAARREEPATDRGRPRRAKDAVKQEAARKTVRFIGAP